MTVRSLAALLFLILQVQQAPRPSIEGTVFTLTTGDPLSRALVTLSRIVPQPPPPQPGQPSTPVTPPPQTPPLLTDREGKFAFRNLEPGRYMLRVQRNGFSPAEYGQKTPTSSGTQFELADGQQMKDVTFKLTPAAIVTGRVRDANGEPVPSVTVSLLQSSYNTNGQRSYYEAGSGTTDDRGEYRVFWVQPGRYIASVVAGSDLLALGFVRTQMVFPDRTFPRTYYPGALDPARATVLDVKAGAELTAIDFVVTQPGMFKVRGRVVDATTGKPPSSASVTLAQRQEQPSSSGLTLSDTGRNVTYNSADGSFEIRNVIPGTYWLRGQASSNLDQPINPALVTAARTASDLLNSVLSNRNSAQVPIDVTGSDLEGLVLALSPGISIPVRLSVEGQELSTVAGYDRVRIQLRATVSTASSTFQRATFSPEGASTLDGVAAGEYRIQINTPSQDFYVKAATFERTDVLTVPWQITSQTQGTLSIVLGNKPGQVEGNLVDAVSQPVRGNLVTLIPDQGRDRSELYKTVQTDQNGHFVIRGITPGSYKVFAWEALESSAYYDRDVLSQYEAQGRPVRIQESSKETVDLKIIPVPK